MVNLPGSSTFVRADTARSSVVSKDRVRHRRPFGEAVLHAPQTLRALVRADEIWLVALAAAVGAIAGLMVTLMTITTFAIHEVLFDLPPGQRLSGAAYLDPIRSVAVPTLGGLVVGLFGLLVARYWPRRAIDPIEANALYGGRMSLNDSLVVVPANGAVERVRRLGRAGGRIHADRLGLRVADRAQLPGAAE